jgi:hypothetical protein
VVDRRLILNSIGLQFSPFAALAACVPRASIFLFLEQLAGKFAQIEQAGELNFYFSLSCSQLLEAGQMSVLIDPPPHRFH